MQLRDVCVRSPCCLRFAAHVYVCLRALYQGRALGCLQATNPYAHEELFEVRVEDPFHELHLVTDAAEWRFLREVRSSFLVSLFPLSTSQCWQTTTLFRENTQPSNYVLCMCLL